MSDEDSEITIFNIKDLSIKDVIKTDQSIINGIIFYKDFLITSSYEKNMWLGE